MVSFLSLVASCAAGLLLVAAADIDSETEILIEDFSDPLHVWRTFGDPHMGGVSDGSFSVDRYEGVGRFFGTIKALPEKDGRNNKGAIGFYRAEAGALGDPSSFPDVRGCEGIRFKLRSEGWDYSGFLVGFGSTKPRNSTGRFSRARGYRAELHMPPQKGDEYVNVELPFGSFTSEWDAGSGSEIAACQDDSHDEGSSNCPDDKTKADPRPIMVYAKGKTGTYDLRIKTITAYDCDPNYKALDGDSNEDDTPDVITLEDFSLPRTINKWQTMDDPVMGGKSHSTFSIERGVGALFEGQCEIVPKLGTPGFITASTGKSGRFAKGIPAAFPDISTCDRILIETKSWTDYGGYYLSFGTDRAEGMRHGRGYKVHMDKITFSDISNETLGTPRWAGKQGVADDFDTLEFPFSSFSSLWDEGTGESLGLCSEDSAQYCPTLSTLRNIETMTIWAEGVSGKVELGVRSIKAAGCRSGGYAKIYGFAEDKSRLEFGPFSTLLPGVLFVSGCAILVFAARYWRERQHASAVARGDAYGEVPPVMANVEVEVLRAELVEMRKAMSVMAKGSDTECGQSSD